MSSPETPAEPGVSDGGVAPSRERIAEALAALDARNRELLDYSMRRRVSDEMLARLYQTDEAEIAQRRVAAVQRMTGALDARGATGLGRVLTALLEQQTWDIAVASDADDQPARGVTVPRRLRPRPGRLALAVAGIALLVGLGGGLLAAGLGGDGGSSSAAAGTRYFAPESGGALGNPFPTGPPTRSGNPTALVRRKTALLDAPEGRRLADLAPRTTWNSPRVLAVAETRPGWLAVRAPELPNGRVGWIPDSAAERGAVNMSLRADLSERRITVFRDGEVVRRMTVGIGGPKTPTPTGTFGVTDKLKVKDPNSPYGCCALALTGHQPKLPAGWPGGDRIAVHATSDRPSIGGAGSYGCFRASPANARWLIETVPLGAPIEIRA